MKGIAQVFDLLDVHFKRTLFWFLSESLTDKAVTPYAVLFYSSAFDNIKDFRSATIAIDSYS